MRWTSLVAACCLLALAACGNPTSSAPAPEAETAPPPTASEETPAPETPAPQPQPEPQAPGETPAQSPQNEVHAPAEDRSEAELQIPNDTAPATRDHGGETAAPQRPDHGAAGPPAAADGAGPQSPNESLARSQDRSITPVLVELLPSQERAPRQGGSAAVLLADPASAVGANKNLTLCRGLFLRFDQATSDEAAIGVRHGAEGELELLRPIYWLTRALNGVQTGPDLCPERLASFDYPRAGRIARKLGLSGPGPYLVIERNDALDDERVAAVIDLSRTAPDRIDAAVRYFRDGFMHVGDIWDPEHFTQTRARSDLVAFLGDQNADYGFLPRLVRATRQVGCPLANLLDVCSEPG